MESDLEDEIDKFGSVPCGKGLSVWEALSMLQEFVDEYFDLALLSLNAEPYDFNSARIFCIVGVFVHHKGIRVQYDLSKPANQRVVSISMLCTECRVPKYEPLDLKKKYTVVMPSYMVDGGDGFTMIKEEILKHNTGDMDISVFSKYISDMKRVYPAVEGRITFRNLAVLTAHNLGLLLPGLCVSLTL